MDTPASGQRFEHTRYTVRRQVFRLFGAAFHIYDSAGQLAFYSNLKAFKLKEDIRVYTDETRAVEVLSIQARQIIDFSAAYDVVDTQTGQKVGALRRRGLKSLFRDAWVILDARDQPIGNIQEDSGVKAFFRRWVELVAFFMPQRYHGEVGGQPVCVFQQNFNPFVPKITLDFSMDRQRLLDRRLAIAAAVLLAAIEGRQR